MMSPQGWKTYRNFVLKIEPAGEGAYWAKAEGPEGGEGKSRFVLPFDENDLETFRSTAGRPRNIRFHGLIPEPSRPVVDFGEKLFNAVFKDEVRDIFFIARNEAEQEGYGLRLRLRLVDVPELAGLPWEFLYEKPDFLALSTSTPLVRYLDLPSPPRSLKIALPLRILVTVSSPDDLPELDLAREQANIQQALAGLIKEGELELEFSQDASLQTLQRTLRQARSQGRPFHVWHFIGHGVFDSASQTGQLAFCAPNGILSLVDGFQLSIIVGDYPEIRLILLNACEGAQTSRQDPFAGVAASLVERGIPAVIGMQFEISDEAAIVFSEGFYTSLVDGLPVDAALTQARISIISMPNWVEWATPVLFMRSPDGVLFKIQRRSSREPAESLVPKTAQAGILPRKRRQKPVAPAEIQPQQPKEAEFDVKDIQVKLINKEIAGLTWTLQIQFEREVKTLFIKYYMSLGSSNRKYEIFVDDRKIDYDLVPQHNNIRPGFWVDDNLSFEVIAENKKYRFNFIHKKKGHWPELKLLGYIIELKINSESVYKGESTF